MLPIAYYFLQVVLCSGLMMGYYWLVLRNKRFHHYNRFYLLAILLLSWAVPLIKISWSHPIVNDDPQMIRLLSVVADNNSQFEANMSKQGFQWSWDYLALGIYLLLAVILLAGMLRALYKIYQLLKTHSYKNVEEVYLVLTQAAGTPFSFFRFIFWNEAIDLKSEAGKQILVHELTHVREKHSYDKIAIQLVLIGGWFNPFFWLLKKEMDMIHEFIADNKAVKNGDTASLAQMLLTAAYPRQQFALTNPFFFSSIKRRLHMLTHNQRPRFSYLRRLIVLPLLAILVILFSFRSKEQRANGSLSVGVVIENMVESVTQTLSTDKKDLGSMVSGNAQLDRTYTVVIDAGHGGKDKGAIAADGTTESSLTLQLAKQIEAINSNDKIHIILRRNADVYDPVTRIADLANQQNPDLFISLHLNNSNAASSLGMKMTGFEYFIPSKEKASDYLGSQLLATSISDAMASLNKPSLGIKSRDKGIWVLGAVKTAAVLIEAGFLSNKEELTSLKDADYQAKLAQAILNGINTYIIQSSMKQAKAKEVTTDTTIHVSVNGSYVTNAKPDTAHLIRDAVGVFDKSSVLKFRDMYFVLDGKRADSMILQNIQPNEIQSVNIIKGEEAIKLYGNAAVNGAIVIVTKESAKQPAPLYIIDGIKVRNASNLQSMISTDEIARIDVRKDEGAVKEFGEDAKHGVIVITSKKMASKNKNNQVYVSDIGLTKNGQDQNQSIRNGSTITPKEYRLSEDVNNYNNQIYVSDIGLTKNGQYPSESTRNGSTISPKAQILGEEVFNILYVVNGKKMDKSFNPNAISMADVVSINSLLPKQARSKYGEEGKYGAKEIFTKEFNPLTRTVYPAYNPNVKVTTVKRGEPIFTSTEIPAEFPGGDIAWEKYLLRNVNSHLIKDKGGPGGKYTVVVSFFVDKEGNISSVQALNDPGYGAKAAAENVISKGPRWKPAAQNGQLVNSSVKRSIIFEVK